MKSTAAISGLTVLTPEELRKKVWETPENERIELDCIDQFDKPVHVSFKQGTIDALMIMEASMSTVMAPGGNARPPGPGLLRT